MRTDEGNLRPDMIVHMPDGRDLVVDVKTPLDAYLDAVDAPDGRVARRGTAPPRAVAIGERVRQLGAKNYWSQFERSPDFVILFIPGDQFLSAALAETSDAARRRDSSERHHRDAVEFRCAAESVAYGWRQMALAQNAETIRELARGPVQAPGCVRRPPGRSGPQPLRHASMRSTAQSVRSNARCCQARASSRSSACVRRRRSKRSNPSNASRANRSSGRKMRRTPARVRRDHVTESTAVTTQECAATTQWIRASYARHVVTSSRRHARVPQ